MKYLCLLILITKGVMTVAQPNQLKFVACNGGDITKNGVYTVHSVIGEMVVGEFSGTSYSGTIGFLDNDDSLVLGINLPINTNDHLIKVYPNPATGNVSIGFLVPNREHFSITVTNSVGVSIFLGEFSTINSGEVLLDKGIFLTSGIYFVSVLTNAGIITEKLVITR